MNRSRIFGLFLLAGAVFIGCIYAANWQYERHQSRSQLSSTVLASLNMQPTNLNSDAMDLIWRKIEVTGKLISEPKLARQRPLSGRNGFWVMSTLQTPQGKTFPVLLGWIPAASSAKAIVLPPQLPTDNIQLTGITRELEQYKQTSGLPIGQISSLDAKNLNTTANFFIQALQVSPNYSDSAIKYVPIPNISTGPHLFYAIQWLVFGLIALIGAVVYARTEKLNVKTKSS